MARRCAAAARLSRSPRLDSRLDFSTLDYMLLPHSVTWTRTSIILFLLSSSNQAC